MNCHEVRRHWHLYHDSEGDAEVHFQVNEHLAMCRECAEWFGQQSRLERLIGDRLAAAPATPELWRRALVASGLARPARSRRLFLFAGLAAGLAAAALIVGFLRPARATD